MSVSAVISSSRVLAGFGQMQVSRAPAVKTSRVTTPSSSLTPPSGSRCDEAWAS